MRVVTAASLDLTFERAGISGLAEGQKVSYDLEKGRDGKVSATNLSLL